MKRRQDGQIDRRRQVSRERWDTGEPYQSEFIEPLRNAARDELDREIAAARREAATATIYRRWPDNG